MELELLSDEEIIENIKKTCLRIQDFKKYGMGSLDYVKLCELVQKYDVDVFLIHELIGGEDGKPKRKTQSYYLDKKNVIKVVEILKTEKGKSPTNKDYELEFLNNLE